MRPKKVLKPKIDLLVDSLPSFLFWIFAHCPWMMDTKYLVKYLTYFIYQQEARALPAILTSTQNFVTKMIVSKPDVLGLLGRKRRRKNGLLVHDCWCINI